MHTSTFNITNRHGDAIRGDIHFPEHLDTAPVLLICHGFKGFKDWGFFPFVASEFAARGCISVRFNFSLNGIADDFMEFTALDRFERNSISRGLDDIDDVMHALRTGTLLPQECRSAPFIALGHSLGGGIAIVKAAEDERIMAVASWAGVSTFDRWGKEVKEQWRKQGRMEILNARTGQMMPMGIVMLEDIEANALRYDIPAAAAKCNKPLLLVHGQQDVSVPIEEAHRIASNVNPALTNMYIIPVADHTFGAVHPFRGNTPALDEAIAATAMWLDALRSS